MTFYQKWRQRVYPLILFIVLSGPFATNADDQQAFQNAIKTLFPHTQVGLQVINLKTGDIPLDINGHTLFTPASVMKILTAAVALKILGPNYQCHTDLYQKGEDYYLQFNNDPTLLYAGLIKLFAPLKGKTIAGNLVIVINNDGFPPYSQKSQLEDNLGCTGNPMDGAMIDSNTAEFMMKHGQKAGDALIFEPLKNHLGFTIVNEAKTCACDDTMPFSCELDREELENGVRIYGCYDQKYPDKKICFPVTHTQKKLRAALTNVLQELHIQLKGQLVFDQPLPQTAKRINQVHSSPIKEMLDEVLSMSDNLIARTLFIKALKKARPDFYKWDQVDTLLKEILPQYFDLQDIEHCHFHEGVGSSTTQSITPAFINSLLAAIAHDSSLSTLIRNTLAQPGKRSTYKNRLPELKGNLWVKTGYMSYLTNLAGYMKTQKGTSLAFTIFVNHIPLSLRQDKLQRLDQLVKAIYDTL